MNFNLIVYFFIAKLQTILSLKILLHSDIGGRSHIKAVLEIGDELQKRQHQVIYAAVDDNQRFLKGHTNISYIPLGTLDETKKLMKDMKAQTGTKNPINPTKAMAKTLGTIFPPAYNHVYPQLSKIIKEENPDVMVCDIFSTACFDAAEMNRIPVITGTQTSDAFGVNDAKFLTHYFGYGPITTEKASFYERFQDSVILPLSMMYHFTPVVSKLNQVKERYGVPKSASPFPDYSRTLVIANTFVGFEPAIPTSPNVKKIGPIMSKSVPPLTSELESFLEKHERVIYVGFGSNAVLASFDIENIVLGCLKALENGLIDGVVWGLGRTKRSDFPETFNYSGKSFTSEYLFNEHAEFRILDWAPQVAILSHPHIILFLSHGGLESSFEAITTKTPVLCMAFFGDQPRNARKLEDAGVGIYINRLTVTPAIMNEKIRTLLVDPKLPFNLERMYNLAEDNGQVEYAANLIESYAINAKLCRPHHPYVYGQPGCEAAHFVPVTYNMSFIKAYQIDAYLLAATIVSFSFIVSCYYIYTQALKLQKFFMLKFSKTKKE